MRGLRIRADGDEVLIESSREVVVIGRGPEARVRCQDSRVSRRHLLLRPENGGWLVEDPGSANGTFRDGDRIESFTLLEPTSLRLGDPATGVVVELVPDRGDETVVLDPDSTRLHESPPPLPPPGPSRAGVVRIGRSASNDIVLEDLQVSRQHAELVRDGDGAWELVDLGSHNGTFVNGSRITRARLTEDDLVSFAGRRMRFTGGALAVHVDAEATSLEALSLIVRSDAGAVLLDEVTFSLGRCSFLAVVGTSGAGKSTLLNALAGFRPAQEGSVLFGGRDLYASYEEMRQRIGYVPQVGDIFEPLTVMENLEVGGYLLKPSVIPQRIEEVCSVFPALRAMLRRRADKLSGGERKMLAIARVLMLDPLVLILDEPTANLSPQLADSLLRERVRGLAGLGKAVLLVEQRAKAAMQIANWTMVMVSGINRLEGPPDDLLGRSDFEAIFLGAKGTPPPENSPVR